MSAITERTINALRGYGSLTAIMALHQLAELLVVRRAGGNQEREKEILSELAKLCRVPAAALSEALGEVGDETPHRLIVLFDYRKPFRDPAFARFMEHTLRH